MDLSLDDIIKMKKNIKPGKQNKKKEYNKQKTSEYVDKSPRKYVVDARNKIITKNRLKIRDAREKLAEITMASGDARLKLQSRSEINKRLQTNHFKNKVAYNIKPKKRQIMRLSKLMGAPIGYIDYDNMETVEEEYNSFSTNLKRTVHNNTMAPSFGSYELERTQKLPASTWNNAPFKVNDMSAVQSTNHEKKNIHQRIRNHSPDIFSFKDNKFYRRKYSHNSNPSYLSYQMRFRLENTPDLHTSKGIFANPLKQTSSMYSPNFRIVVSNLHGSVTQNDIKELFEDIGELNDSRLVRAGVAEVVFRNLIDAEKAVDTYHNRQLDGQPMKCLLVNPRSWNKPTAPAIKTKNSNRSTDKTPLEIDIDALHKVLFQRN